MSDEPASRGDEATLRRWRRILQAYKDKHALTFDGLTAAIQTSLDGDIALAEYHVRRFLAGRRNNDTIHRFYERFCETIGAEQSDLQNLAASLESFYLAEDIAISDDFVALTDRRVLANHNWIVLLFGEGGSTHASALTSFQDGDAIAVREQATDNPADLYEGVLVRSGESIAFVMRHMATRRMRVLSTPDQMVYALTDHLTAGTLVQTGLFGFRDLPDNLQLFFHVRDNKDLESSLEAAFSKLSSLP